MKPLIRYALYVVVPCALVIGLGSAFARGPHHGRNPERMKRFVDYRVNETLDELDATDAQRVQILGIVDALVAKVQAEHERGERKQLADAVVAAIESANPDTRELDRLIDERAQRMTALAHEAVAAARGIHAQLTPEQRKELAERVREHHGHFSRF